MRATIALLALSGLAGCVSWSGNSPRVSVPGPEPLRVEVPQARTIELNLANGEATVVAASVDHVSVTVDIRCPESSTRCRDRASKVALTSGTTRDGVRFEFDGSLGSGAEVNTEVQVPVDRPLVVRMKYGELNIENLEQDLSVRMTAGDIDLSLPERSVGRAELGATFGESSARTDQGEQEGRRPLLVGSKIEWDGDGQNSVTGRVRFGDIQLVLTP